MPLKKIEKMVDEITRRGWMGRYDAFFGVLNRLETKELMELYSAIPIAVDRSESKTNMSFREQMIEKITLHCTF